MKIRAVWIGCLLWSEATLCAPALSEQLTLAGFQALLGESFQTWSRGQGLQRAAELQLVEIDDRSRPGDPVEQFRLIFETDPDNDLGKDGYYLEHPGSGRFLLFLEPAAPRGERAAFTADLLLLKAAPAAAPLR